MEVFRRLRRARGPTDFSEFEEPIRAELFSAERLEQHAQSLAVAQTVTKDPADERALVPRVRENGQVLHEAHKLIGNAARQRLAITPAAEWLLDNFHVVEDQLRDIREHLPTGYYKKLPKELLKLKINQNMFLFHCMENLVKSNFFLLHKFDCAITYN